MNSVVPSLRNRSAFSFSRVALSVSSVFLLASWCISNSANAQDWNSVSFINHNVYQAVDSTGKGTYPSSGFPTRLIGVVLNNNEDWLNPKSGYCEEAGHPWFMGGEAEFYVQAVNLDGTIYDPYPTIAFNDFGGTSCWLGQNYGNVTSPAVNAHYDAANYEMMSKPYNYTQAEWYGELDRLSLYYPGTTRTDAQLVRAGDLVEIRVRGGLFYKGKTNVNEKHMDSPTYDFEVVLLQKDFGLPEAVPLSLDALKNDQDQFIFDSTRATGNEKYQSSLVTLQNVRLQSTTGWGQNADLTLVDDVSGLTYPVHLCLDESFSSTAAPTGLFNVTGILDQNSYNFTNGYRLLVMNAGDFQSVPEPSTLLLLAACFATMFFRRMGRKRID